MPDSGSVQTLTDIAVIGMAGRFPGARNIDEFWQNLRDGVESISFFSDQELEASGISSATFNRPDYVRAKFALENIEWFDASFFGITPREAELMDPQHRLFLECAWEALEDAGYNPGIYRGLIGLYGGSGANMYLLMNLYPHLNPAESFGFTIANEKDHLATRVSYKLDLRGPSVTVQTACSTSLVAVHMAYQSLLSYQCDIALAGGVTVKIPPKAGYFSVPGVTSPDGRCRAFSDQAQGMGVGEGAAIVVLKRLADALADGDYIHAVIKGMAMNNDGSAKVGYTAPGVDGQAEAIVMAQSIAGVDPRTITYMETHGTATPLGDPIEVAALTRAFRARTNQKGFCAIGSVKTNIGHTDAAAGVAGLIKTVLALEHKQIPPSLNFERPNPEIDFANSPFYVNTKLSKWETGSTPRRAGVSSFGLGGTNVHAVLEQAPPVKTAGSSRPWQLLVLSAKTSCALDACTANLVGHLKQYPNLNLADVAHTLQVGREAFDYRRAAVCRDLEDAVAALESSDPERVFSSRKSENVPVVFMFPGGGAQYVNMGLDLYQTEPVFRDHIDRCAEFLKPRLGQDLRRVLYPSAEQTQEASAQLERMSINLPALFAVEYAVAKLWISLGVTPQAMIGHSLGEYVAACLAGVFSLEDALSLVAERGRLFELLPDGAMLGVPLSEDQVQPYLTYTVSLAAINAPSLCVVSGPPESINQIARALAEKGLKPRRLHVSRAAHSEMLAPILETFGAFVGKLDLRAPNIPYISNVTGAWITAAEATDPSYWTRHLRQTVRFSQGIQEILKDPSRVMVEVGPGQTLSALTKKHLDISTERIALASMRHPNDLQSDAKFLLNTLGKLWIAGVSVDWPGLHACEQRYRIPLPTYPFERQRYWIEPAHKWASNAYLAGMETSKKQDIAEWFYSPSWKRSTLSRSFRRGDLENRPRCWLVLVDQVGLGSGIVEKLEQEGQAVITAAIGEQFERVGERAYTVNPQQPDDYEALLKELEALDKFPQAIVHLWNVAPARRTRRGIHSFEPAQHTSFCSLLFLVRSIRKRNTADSVQIRAVSSNMQNVTGEETLCPEKATWLAVCEAARQEYPNISCHSIDLDISSSAKPRIERLVDQLMTEVSAAPSDPAVAFRGEYRWVLDLEQVQLVKTAQDSAQLREDKVYLVTDGLGNLGYQFAECLARLARPRLALVERSGLPGREHWDQWLSAGQAQRWASRALHIEMEDEQDNINRLEKEAEKHIHIEQISPGLERAADELAASYIYEYLRTNGAKGQSWRIGTLKQELRILTKFEKMYRFFIKTLAEDGIIRIDGEKIEFLQDTQTIRSPSELKAELVARYPEYESMTRLLEHCVRHYSQALTGEIEAISVLFPDGTTSLMEASLAEWAKTSHAHIYVRLVADLLPQIVRSQNRKLKILEVGAGSGQLTWPVTAGLRGKNVEYHFTDIGKSFIVNAEKKARQEGLDLKFGILDISKEPVEQGYREHSFDIILAFNVVHATRSIAETIGNLGKLLAPNGLLLILEATRTWRTNMMIDGLAEGWWYFEDTDVRKYSPLLSASEWESALRKQGFKSVRAWPQSEEKRAQVNYALIVAQQLSKIPGDASWEWLVETSGWQETLTKIQKVKALEELGAKVLVAQADVGDEKQVRSVIAQARKQLGAIHGVIHAVESVKAQQLPGISEIDCAECEQFFRSRAHGIFALEQSLQSEQLDFSWIVHSPLNSNVAEQAANRFLDAYANAKDKKLRWTSITWDAAPSVKDQTEPAIGAAEPAVAPDSLEAFRHLLSMNAVTQVTVSPRIPPAKAGPGAEPGPLPQVQLSEPADALAAHSRPRLQTAFVAPRNETEQTIANIWQEAFGIGQVGIHDNFYELGGESLLATQIVSRICAVFEIELSLRSLFENPTVAGLAQLVEKARGSGVNLPGQAIVPISREAYRAKRSPGGEIETHEAARSLAKS